MQNQVSLNFITHDILIKILSCLEANLTGEFNEVQVSKSPKVTEVNITVNYAR